jgi:hypothetical protein
MPYKVQLPPDIGKSRTSLCDMSLPENSGDSGDGVGEGLIQEQIRPEPEAPQEMPSVPAESILAEHSNAEVDAIIDVWRRLFGASAPADRQHIGTQLKNLREWQGRQGQKRRE